MNTREATKEELVKVIAGLQKRVAELEARNAELTVNADADRLLVNVVEAENITLKKQNLMLAKLSANQPMFCNPFDVIDAENLRDEILKGGE